MSQLELTVRNEPALGPDARQYRVACSHGVSSAVLLPGRRPLADLAVFDVLMVGHHRKQGCRCGPGMPMLQAEARA